MDTHVVVIGAGVAGLAAAKHLADAGIAVTIIEARDRIGGRIHTVRDDAVTLPIELGAEFVDIPGPAWNAVRDAGGTAYRSVGGMWDVRDRAAHPLDMNTIADRVLGRLAQPPAIDTSFREWLAGQHGISDDDAELALHYVEGFHAADPDRVGVQWLSHTVADSGGGGGAERFHVLGGFDLAARGLQLELADRCELLLGTIVSDVAWSRNHVDVTCRHDPAFHGDAHTATVHATHAVVTLPLGVLQADDAVRFAPRIDDTINAARTMARANVIKVVLAFSEPFWNDAIEFHDGEQPSPERKFLMTGDVFPAWWTPSPVIAPHMTAWAGGPATDRVRALGDPVDVALDAFARLVGTPRRVIDDLLVRAWFHDWENDRFARSAYSYVPAGAMPSLARLRQPIDDTLFVAGEATAEDGWNGTVDGAIESGRRAAREIMERTTDLPL